MFKTFFGIVSVHQAPYYVNILFIIIIFILYIVFVYLIQHLSLTEYLHNICLTQQCYLYGKQAVSLELPGSTCGMR